MISFFVRPVVFHVDCKSGRKLRHIPKTCHSNVFVSAVNLTDLSPSGPARRLAELDLGLNCLYDQSQTFAFLKCFQKQTINVLRAVAFFLQVRSLGILGYMYIPA